MDNLKFKILIALCALGLWPLAFALRSKSAPEPSAQADRVAVVGDSAPLIKRICSNIYEGNFAAARQLTVLAAGRDGKPKNPAIGQLGEIISEYDALEANRHSSREDAYQEQLEKLEKLRVAADVNDFEDVNDIPEVLLVVAKAVEFANEAQREQLLSRPFVKQTITAAIEKATELESKGKWLDAYIVCYSGLERIDEENKAYSDYSDQLLQKANIVASFQDSPCETSKERYAGVKKQMFIRSLDYLDRNYVSRVIDYDQMATKTVKRCELLAEVMKLSFSEIVQSEAAASLGEGTEGFLTPPDDEKLAAWSEGLAFILDQVKRSPTGISKDKFLSIFEKVLELNTTTVQLPRTVLIAQFAEAALSALDRYTVIVWPKNVSEFEKSMTNTFTGIGIRLGREKKFLTVASLLPDTPAYHSGLDAGDVIEKVDGVETKDMTATCAVKRITGPEGTDVTLTIRRPGNDKTEDKIMDITITRAKIIVPTIRGWQRTEKGKTRYMIDEQNKIGYIRIISFDSQTPADFEKALVNLEKEGLKGLVLDLRVNFGGLLNSATEIADKFIEEEGIIVTTQPRFGTAGYTQAHKKNTHPNYPLVVLIDRFSASASEIVAGALADHKYNRAILVGERSHGKGSVQTINNKPGQGAQLKYTMAYYLLPSGQRVNSQEAMKKLGSKDWGVAPNVEVKLTSDEGTKMNEVHWDNLVLAKADHDREAEPLKKHAAEEVIAADPQLAVAILVIKSKLIEDSMWRLASGI